MKKIAIGQRLIGEQEPCFIIAEAGVNHNGNIHLAKKLIDAAKSAGADAIKFQTFKARQLVTEKAQLANYQRKNLGRQETQLQMLTRLELNQSDFEKLKSYCDQKKITFLSTPHCEEAVDFLDPLMTAYKVGSGDLTNLVLLEKIAKKKKPIILSTGMANLAEIKEATTVIKKQKNNKIILLHCTTNYPCPLPEVNLKAMLTLKNEFNLPVGYSDHTTGRLVPLLAVALGAQVIEKHFTLDKKMPGPDHLASIEPVELKEMILRIRQVEQVLGDGIKRPQASERRIKAKVRKSLVAQTDISPGTIVTQKMIAIKRPGTGIQPKHIGRVIGRQTIKPIKRDTLLKYNYFK